MNYTSPTGFTGGLVPPAVVVRAVNARVTTPPSGSLSLESGLLVAFDFAGASAGTDITKVTVPNSAASPLNRVVTVSSTTPAISEGGVYGVVQSSCRNTEELVDVQVSGVALCNVYAIKATVPARTWDAGSIVYASQSSADGAAHLPDGLIFNAAGKAAVGILLEPFTLSGGAGSSAVLKKYVLLSGYTLGTAAG